MKLPENIKAIIDSNVPPSMRDYYYRMVYKESTGRPELTSSTGAKGLLQFTKGTGKAYGLVGDGGDKRADPVANIQAGVRLTEDNRKTLARTLGREPTLSELALAHQQGAGTAARMISGVGNASPENLRVNKVDPNAPPQEAANKIMAYYGFGDRPASPPGMTLAYNPVLPTGTQPIPPAAAFPPAPPPPPPQPPGTFDQIRTALLGSKGDAGKDSGISDLQQISNALRPKVDPRTAEAAATIQPMSSMPNVGNPAAAQQLMAALLANKRQKFGLTLTDRMP